MKFMAITTAALFGLVRQSVAHGHEVEFYTIAATVPKAISDHSASLAPNNLIYIAGGCDSPNGNVYIEEEQFFACDRLSKSFYSFDYTSETFKTLADLPRERYRHAAVAVEGQVWLVGGRDAEDQIIPQVDVYSIADNTWSTFTDLEETYQISDHAGFGSGSIVYMTGGYDQNYTAQGRTFRIDTTASTSSLMVEEVASLITARGDIHGVTTNDGNGAFVGGGFTHANGFCAPLGSVERYNFATNSWSSVPNLVNPRGEIVFVEIEDELYGLGGERQIENICDITDQNPDPGELTIAEDDVEVLEGNNNWKIVAEFPSHKFRFAAVGVEKDGKPIIYTFGGQTSFDDDCACFRTSNEVNVFGADVERSSGFSIMFSTATTLFGIMVATVSMMTMMML